jgi:hypothetical protein
VGVVNYFAGEAVNKDSNYAKKRDLNPATVDNANPLIRDLKQMWSPSPHYLLDVETACAMLYSSILHVNGFFAFFTFDS